MKTIYKVGIAGIAIFFFNTTTTFAQKTVKAKKMRLTETKMSPNSKINYEAEESINTSQVIDNQSEVNQKAGKEITLGEGFLAPEGSTFQAEIAEVNPAQISKPKPDNLHSAVSIFPNPTKDFVKINLDPEWAETQGLFTIKLMNDKGETIHHSQIKGGQESLEINLQGQPKGVYILKINSQAEESFLKRIVLE
jgi:hypothetical protein